MKSFGKDRVVPMLKRMVMGCKNMATGIVMLFFLLIGREVSFAQDPAVTQYMFNTMMYNPGFAGMSNGIAVSLLHRQMWVPIRESAGTESTGTASSDASDKGQLVNPNTTILLADMPVNLLKGGVSLAIASENFAHFNNITIKLGYAYHLRTSFGQIGLGVQALLIDRFLDIPALHPEQEGDPAIGNASEKVDALYGDVSVGAYLLGNQNYFVGISVNNLISHTSDKINYQPTRVLILSGGYNFKIPGLPKIEFSPSTLIKTNFKFVEWDINFSATFNQKFWAGISYRLQDAVSILAGMNIKQFKIGVAYDISASKMIHASKMGGGFEVYFKYNFNLEGNKISSEYKNARYL